MTLYSDMNNKIVDLLRMGDTPVELYAAQRIEELELINMELIDRVLEIIDNMPNANPSYWNKCDVVDREGLREGILALKGGDEE